MKALILGTGAQGSVIVSELVKDPEVTEARLGDINLERARRLAERLKSDKVSIHRVDASNIEDVAKAGRETDLIVNATPWVVRFNLNVMEAALKCGANYQDLASAPKEQLELSDKWKKAGLTALIDAGETPGITNVLVAHVADRLDRVEKIRVRFGEKVVEEPEEDVPYWSPESEWLGFAMDAIAYEDGRFKKVPPFSDEEVYPFPEPVGPVTVSLQNHEESETLPLFIGKGVRYVDFKMGEPIFPLAKAIARFGLLSDKPREFKGVKVAPRDVFFSLLPPTLPPEDMERKRKAGLLGKSVWCTLVEVEGEKAGEKLTYTIHWVAGIGPDEPMIPITGISASIFARMLGKGRIKTKGVVPPEALEPEVRQAFLAELTKYGIDFTERVQRRLP